MSEYRKLSPAQMKAEYELVRRSYEMLKEQGLKLDMSRGKPCAEQLDLVSGLLTILSDPRTCVDSGIDVRNYGEFMGIPSCRNLFAELLGTRPEEIFVGGNASIQLMYDVISKACSHGLLHSPRPWSQEKGVKFLCPAPGYDNHFRICETFGLKMITIPMTACGPDMDAVESVIKDPTVKGIWCVPKYSNPQGIVYSDETVARLAALRPAAPDFVLMWDNAYCVHELDGVFVPFRDILTLCREAGNPDMVFEFASTSKMTMPGAGVSAFATSEANMAYITRLMSAELISYDKVNMLRHVRFLKNKEHILELMKEHAAIMKPKFDVVLDVLDKELGTLEIGRWNRPRGGYFISYDAMPGTACRTLELCTKAGVVMASAGATFPYGVDPADANIRIAPTRPPVSELQTAIEVFCICARLAALEHLMRKTTA